MHVLATESRLYHRSRPAPHIAVADNKAISKQHLHALETRAFLVLAVPACQDLSNLGSIVHKIRQAPVWLIQTHHIAILSLQVPQRGQRLGI